MTNCFSNETKDLSFPISVSSAYMFGPFICVSDEINGIYVLDIRTQKVDHWETKITAAGYLYDGHYDRLLLYAFDGKIYDFTTKLPFQEYNICNDQSIVVCKHCDNHILELVGPHPQPLVINSAFNLS
jgi:hypothetical protein